MGSHSSPSASSKTLHAFFTHLQTMHIDSPARDFDTFGRFLTPDCITQLRSMREPLVKGRDAAVRDLKEHLEYWHLDEPRIVAQATSEDGKTVMFEMANKLSIAGDLIDPFPETAVAGFDDAGLIESLKIYNCQSPVVWIVQQKTGAGPYHEAELKEDNEQKYHIRRNEGGGCRGCH